MGMTGKKFGVLVGDFLVTAVFSAIILMLVGWFTGFIESIRFGTALVLILGAVFFIFAMKIHPGKEDLFTDLPMALFILALFAGLASVGVTALHFVIEMTPLVGIAFGFGSIYFAKTLSTLLFRKVFKLKA